MRRFGILAALTIALLSALTAAASAQIAQAPGGGFLNGIQNQYQTATSAWLTAAMGWATVIFAGLITVEIAWSVFEIFVKNRDIDSLLGSFIFRVVWIGTAVFLLNQAPNIVIPAIQDFVRIGTSIASASGTPTNVTPDDIFTQGWSIAGSIWNSDSQDNIVTQTLEGLPLGLSAISVLFAFAVVAAQLLLTEIQIFFVVGAGAFLLGFMGSRWTLPFAETYPRMVLVSGLKLVAITLVVGLGKSLGAHWAAAANTSGLGPVQYMSIAASSVVYAIIAWNLPSLIAAFAGATPAFNAAALVSSGARLASSVVPGGGAAYGAASGATSGAGGARSNGIASIEKATSLE